MRSTLILAIFALFFVSCHSDVPNLPSPDDVSEYKWCGYGDKNVSGRYSECESVYKISKTDCERVGGELFEDSDCKKPCKDCEE